ncbi:MAG: hypothetical protein KA129_08820 [Microthrixaceae bacterium]|nr:hypothetical protein [Microthrixaceae bacterium]
MFGDFKRRLRDAALIEEALVKLAAVTEPARLPAVLAEVDRREAMFKERNGTGRPPRLEALEFVLDDVVRERL